MLLYVQSHALSTYIEYLLWNEAYWLDVTNLAESNYNQSE